MEKSLVRTFGLPILALQWRLLLLLIFLKLNPPQLTPYYGGPAVKYEDKVLTEEKVFYADSNFFEFFSFRLLEGDIKTALKEPNTVVLTEDIAKKYFGRKLPVGKLLVIGK